MIDGEKKGRVGAHTFGSMVIIIGFVILIGVLFGGGLVSDIFPMYGVVFFYVGGFLVGFLCIFFGVVVSDKARGKAKVSGFMLNGAALDEAVCDESLAKSEDE